MYNDDILEERDDGIRRAVVSYFELKIKHPQIIGLLQKYWKISEEEANEFYREEKNINSPCRALEYYLQSEGWSAEEIDTFFEKYRVALLLNRCPELRTITPDKLKKEVEKRKIKPVTQGRIRN